MAEESFLLVSLQDERAKKLSEVISNKTARKILGMLAEKKYTESELAKELGMPISTVHYNIQLLLSAGLIKAIEYHYSAKGKEVNHYEIVNKLIVISPGKEKEGLGDLLKKFLPIAVIVGAISIGIEFSQRFALQAQGSLAPRLAAVPTAAPMFAKQAADSASEAAPSLMAAVAETAPQTIHYSL
jgi:DNA-binding transcriptional ArsR family regulator